MNVASAHWDVRWLPDTLEQASLLSLRPCCGTQCKYVLRFLGKNNKVNMYIK